MSLINRASLEVSDLSIALKAVPMRVLWSYVLMDCGVEFVMKDGIIGMPLSRAINLDCHHMVSSQIIVYTLNITKLLCTIIRYI